MVDTLGSRSRLAVRDTRQLTHNILNRSLGSGILDLDVQSDRIGYSARQVAPLKRVSE